MMLSRLKVVQNDVLKVVQGDACKVKVEKDQTAEVKIEGGSK